MLNMQEGNNTQCTVFIGNIPYTASEDQLQVCFLLSALAVVSFMRVLSALASRCAKSKLMLAGTWALEQEVFETAGPVVSLRMIRDKDTGQSKGIGFCEYRDVQCAEAAIRILHNYEMNGRLLSVDHAHGNLDKSSAGPSITRLAERGHQVAHSDAGQHAGSAGGVGEMTSTLNNMTARQMYELIGQLKGHVENKDQAKALMTQNHLLCCEFLRMQERLGMLTGINLPAPPARAAPAPNPAPLLQPTLEQPVYAPSSSAATGMGWNVPQVQQPHMRPPHTMDEPAISQHTPFDAMRAGSNAAMPAPQGGMMHAGAPPAPPARYMGPGQMEVERQDMHMSNLHTAPPPPVRHNEYPPHQQQQHPPFAQQDPLPHHHNPMQHHQHAPRQPPPAQQQPPLHAMPMQPLHAMPMQPPPQQQPPPHAGMAPPPAASGGKGNVQAVCSVYRACVRVGSPV